MMSRVEWLDRVLAFPVEPGHENLLIFVSEWRARGKKTTKCHD